MTREELIEKMNRLTRDRDYLQRRIAELTNDLIDAEAEQYRTGGEIDRLEKEIDAADLAEARRREQNEAMEDLMNGDLEDQLERIIP